MPDTEARGRRHTSTIAVAVLPEDQHQQSDIKKEDLTTETMRGHGKGGQHKNVTDSAVRITHGPTGISAYCDGRSQHQNKQNALSVLKSKIFDKIHFSAYNSRNVDRSNQIGTMGRGSRVRTYNFIENRVKDERVKKKFPTMKIMSGNLDLIYGQAKKEKA